MALMQRFSDLIDSNPLWDKDRYTEDQYLAFEQRAEGRWEFVPTDPVGLPGPRLGIIRAMSGGTIDHSAVASNFITALSNALRAKGNRMCRVFTSDLKIHTADGLNTFPDVSVVCGKPASHKGRRDLVTNPILLSEVLSPSMEYYDRGDKWLHYQSIPNLQHYLLIAADLQRIELYTREETGWRFQIFSNSEDTITLSSLEITIPLADVYAMVEFDDALDIG